MGSRKSTMRTFQNEIIHVETTDAIEALENFFTMAANMQVVLVYGGKTSETRETVRS